MKKYKCDKLKFYTLLISRSKNTCLSDKQYNKVTLLFATNNRCQPGPKFFLSYKLES